MRTTIDLDPLVLATLKKRQAVEGKSMGVLVSELLAVALTQDTTPTTSIPWPTAAMGARLDIEDPDVLWAVLDGP